MNTKPNILFIFIDDMGWKDISCAGSEFYESPNIDKLCRNGMIFKEAYASCPVCSPSRASLLTGKYPARLDVTDWIDVDGSCHPCRGKLIDAPYIKHLPDGEITIAQRLKENGYDTWHVGKWHLGDEEHYPQKYGFDKNVGGCSWGHPHNGYFSPFGIDTLPHQKEGEYLTDRVTSEAINLIKESSDKPFFMNLCHYAVHTPIQAKKEDITYFEEKAKKMGLDKQTSIVDGEYFTTEHLKGRRVKRRIIQSDPAYAAMIYNLDQNIGRILQTLDEVGKMDNTLIIFTSDNGGLSTSEGSPTCNFPASEGKGWMYDGGLRVPLIAKWTGHIKPGSICNIPVTTPDFYPTFMNIIGVDPNSDKDIDGVSILPLFEGKTIAPRPIFWHYPHYGNQGGTPSACVRMCNNTSYNDGDLKLISFFEDGHTELYNLQKDISEKNDVSKENPKKVDELKESLSKWQEQVCAKFPTVNDGYKL